jgi:hypothetical protein
LECCSKINGVGMGKLKRTAILFLSAPTVWATADGPDFWQLAETGCRSEVEIRVEPRFEAERVGNIPSGGSCIRNLGCQGGLTLSEYQQLSEADRAARLEESPRWCKIDFEGVIGWVEGQFLREGYCNTSSLDPVAAPDGTPAK